MKEYDFILKRYGGGADHVLNLPFLYGFEIIAEGIQKDNDEKLYARWINGYQHISFKEFKNSFKKENNDSRSAAEIIADILALDEANNKKV